jgi:hypothetical protein
MHSRYHPERSEESCSLLNRPPYRESDPRYVARQGLFVR